VRRRTFIAGLGGAAAWPLAARAQRSILPTIGWLDFAPQASTRDSVQAFKQGLAEAGYIEGRNAEMAYRWADGHSETLPALAADLVDRQVAIIVASTTAAALAAKAATRTIPIVFRIGSDPVEIGLVASINRPAGNLTGVAQLGSDLAAKRLALLHELVPAAQLVAILVDPADFIFSQAETRDLLSAARALGVRVLVLNAGNDNDIAAAFSRLIELRAGALLISADTFFYAARDQITSLAARYAMPTMYFESAAVPAGALLSYGPDIFGSNHQVGIYAGRILKGERPAELPVMQPTRFELAINLKTAKALGLTIPETLLATADEVIQ
jgi:putative tryptophan/tyrosine transport system substrate-binding protein